MKIALISIGVLIALIMLYVIIMHNRLIGYRTAIRNAWSHIDVQLKRRHNLVLQLVTAVKAIMKMEKELLESISKARSRAVASSSTGAQVAEEELNDSVPKMLLAIENYPELKSNENITQLQNELSETENRIAYTRTHYNGLVANFNTLVNQVPSMWVARKFSIREEKLFNVRRTERNIKSAKVR